MNIFLEFPLIIWYCSYPQFANQNDLLTPECNVHVMVCAKMRAKLVSEVQDNFEKLQVTIYLLFEQAKFISL
jgi:hypothetical protein